ncbi:hypothetical protein R4B61_07585 (plasmid) [Fructilactobacillus vespulae]|uniref:hypothetical protein n=1 Tax=Fructilactobacillus vespulae TaxID=1249630 RepID=UPI0039B57FC5
MAELIDPEIWKETIKHSFELKSQGIDSLLLKNRGTFAHLMHFNMGLSLFENGFGASNPDDLKLVKSLFEDQPKGYGNEIENGWKTANQINDFQYFQNLQYIEQNSIPMIDQIEISDQAKERLMMGSLSTLNEKQMIIDKHPEVFKKEFYEPFLNEIMTEEESVGFGNKLQGFLRENLKGQKSQLLWGVSEKQQQAKEKQVLMEVDGEFRMKELEKQAEIKKSVSLADQIDASYKNIDGFQDLTLKFNDLNHDDNLSPSEQFDALLDKSAEYDAVHSTTFYQFAEDSMHDSQVETVEEAMDRADGQGIDDFDYQSLIDQGVKYINTNDNHPVQQNDFERTIETFNDNSRFEFKDEIKDRLNKYAIFESEVFEKYAAEKHLSLTKDGYQKENQALNEKDFGKIIKDLDNRIKQTELKNKEKVMNDKDITLKINVLKREDEELFKKFIKENDIWQQDGKYKTHSGSKNEVINLTESDYDAFVKEWDQEKQWKAEEEGKANKKNLKKEKEVPGEVHNWVDPDLNLEEAGLSFLKQNQEMTAEEITKQAQKNEVIDRMNKIGVQELDKSFATNESFEQHVTEHGDLYSKYNATNALAISGQIESKKAKNPKISGDSLSIGDRKSWSDKGLYPKNSDSIAYGFTPNREGKIENNPVMGEVKIRPLFTSDSFIKYGKTEKNKSKLANFKYEQTKPGFGMTVSDREKAANKAISKINADEKNSMVKAVTKFVVRKELGLDKGLKFKLPANSEIKSIVNPGQRMQMLDQIHNSVKRAMGIVKVDLYNRKHSLEKDKGKNKGISNGLKIKNSSIKR